MKVSSYLKKNWGFCIFFLDTVLSLLWLLFRNITGHYINFTEPAKYLWRLGDPYQISFPGSPGAFFYSPGCALYYYSLFAFLPQRLGQILYMSSSVLVFWLGLKKILGSIKSHFNFDIETSFYRHLFWLMAASELLGGIIAVKIDVLIVGFLFCVTANLIEKKHVAASLLIAGIITTWKLHPFTIIGLLFISVFADDIKKAFGYAITYFLGLAIGFLSPLLVLPYPFAKSVTLHWISSLKAFISSDWLADIFQHIYGFLARTFLLSISISFANQLTAVIGVFSAILVFFISRKFLSLLGKEKGAVLSLVFALGFGSCFIVVFSQLIQSNSYIIYFPMVLTVILLATIEDANRTVTASILTVVFFTISIVYSDLVPRIVHDTLYHWGVKPLGAILLAAYSTFLCTRIRA